MKSTPIFAALILFWAVDAAADPCAIRSAQDILACALERHPDAAVARAALERDLALKAVARQRPNPELESKVVAGTSAAANDLETETSLLHTVELGGKRKARLGRAAAVGEATAADRQRTLEDVALATVLDLHRLRQIRDERDYLGESIATFGSILGQLKTRPALSPELEVSRSVFEIAVEDYRLKETALVIEEESVKTSLEFTTGLPYTALKNHLPRPKSAWPKVGDAPEGSDDAALLKKAGAEAKVAAAELSLARSRSWPDLKIGPTVETANPQGNGRTGTTVGGTVSLPLPLLNVNRGERKFAAAEKARADLNLQVTRDRLDAERRRQLQRYRGAVKVLSQTRSRRQLADAHKTVDALFDRGIAPPALVIESHRQMVDILTAVHAQELTALDALWRLYILDGRVLEAKI